MKQGSESKMTIRLTSEESMLLMASLRVYMQVLRDKGAVEGVENLGRVLWSIEEAASTNGVKHSPDAIPPVEEVQ